MTEVFLDTNVLLRYLLGDHDLMSPRSTALMRELERGTKRAFTSDLVVAEVIWIAMSAVYRVSKGSIVERLRDIVGLTGLNMPDKSLVLDSLAIFEERRIDYIDAYNVAVMRRRRIDNIYSYDRDFDRVPGITRVVP